jgi:hypothetical protein
MRASLIVKPHLGHSGQSDKCVFVGINGSLRSGGSTTELSATDAYGVSPRPVIVDI